jgi:hypothetical protein
MGVEADLGKGGGSIRRPAPVAGVTMNGRWPARRSLPRDAAAGVRALRDEGRVRCRRSLSHAAARLPLMQGARSAPSGRSRNRALPEKPTSGGFDPHEPSLARPTDREINDTAYLHGARPRRSSLRAVAPRRKHRPAARRRRLPRRRAVSSRRSAARSHRSATKARQEG